MSISEVDLEQYIRPESIPDEPFFADPPVANDQDNNKMTEEEDSYVQLELYHAILGNN